MATTRPSPGRPTFARPRQSRLVNSCSQGRSKITQNVYQGPIGTACLTRLAPPTDSNAAICLRPTRVVARLG
jgi:hypothetical protein